MRLQLHPQRLADLLKKVPPGLQTLTSWFHQSSRKFATMLRRILIVGLALVSLQSIAGPVEEINALGVTFKMTEPTFDNSLPLIWIGERDAKTDTIIYHQSLREVLQAVQATYGFVQLDCKMFAQVAAAILNGDSDKPLLLFLARDFSPTLALLLFSRRFGYVHAKNLKMHEFLQSTSLNNKGQWVVEGEPGQFVGLGSNGQVIAESSTEWMARTKADLFVEIDSRLAESKPVCRRMLGSKSLVTARIPYEDLGLTSAKAWKDAGQLDEWGFTTSAAFFLDRGSRKWDAPR